MKGRSRGFPWLLLQTGSKIGETLPLKNIFPSYQYPPHLQFQPFPLPPSLFSIQCWLFKFSVIFVLLETLIRGEGGCSVGDNRYINNTSRGEVPPLILQLVVAWHPTYVRSTIESHFTDWLTASNNIKLYPATWNLGDHPSQK